MTINNIPIIIPAYEPDEKLPKLIGDLKEYGFENIIVVNDGSRSECDSFFKESLDKGAMVLSHEKNRGKGAALKTAFRYCIENYSDKIGAITADSDGQHSPECIYNCAKALFENPDNLILGCRNFDDDSVPLRSKKGNKITRTTMKLFTGVSVTDTQTGLRGISIDFMRILLDVPGDRYEFETSMLLETKTYEIGITEVPIKTIYIDNNSGSHFNPIKDSIMIYKLFGKYILSSLSSTLIDFALFMILCGVLRGKEMPFGTYITVSTVCARVVSAFYNFTMNYKLVFKGKNGFFKALPKYVLLAVVQMSISAFVVNWLCPVLNVGKLEFLIKLPVDTLLFIGSYFVQREFVYKNKKKCD